MSDSTWSVQEAKNQFSRVVEAAQGEPQTVTKHGKPAAVVLSANEFARLKRIEKHNKPSFTDMLLAIPKGGKPFPRMKFKPRDVDF